MRIKDEFTEGDLAYWADFDPHPGTFNPPEGATGCEPAKAIVTISNGESDMADLPVVRVGWRPDEIDLAHLAQGGTIWLSTWGGLPPHMLEVSPPDGGR